MAEALQMEQAAETAVALDPCDQCGVRSSIKVDIYGGILTFCMHHYNKNAQALTDKGAIAKLLNI